MAATAQKNKKKNKGKPSVVRKAAGKKPPKSLWAIFSGTWFILLVLLIILMSRPHEAREPYMEYGTDTALNLDEGILADPGVKNNLDLAAYVTQAWEHQWGYVWGTFGYQLTGEQLAAKAAQYPEGVGDRLEFIRANWLGRRTADCIGLIKSYSWYDPETDTIGYAINGMPDIDADQMFAAAEESGSLKGLFHRIPEIPGLLVYTPGHIGVYVGDGYVIEARGTEYGVVKTKLKERSFTYWMKNPYIEYYE